jgi:hypothetical protein
MFTFCGTAFAAPPEGYKASPSASEVLCGGSVTFDITTPSEAGSVKAYIGGKSSGDAQLVTTEASSKRWTAEVAFAKAGDSKVTFRAFSQSGKKLCAFPSDPLIITVKHLPPVTEQPIILDCDRAVLLASPPENCGTKQREYGFYMGTDPANLSTKVKSNAVIRGKINELVTGLTPGTAYYFKAYVVTAKDTYYGETLSFTTPAQKTWAAQDAVFQNTADRYMLLFGSDAKFYTMGSPPYGYVGSAEASKQMVKIQVPVWKLRGSKKVSSTMPLTINYKLENNVKAIFQEIYDLDIQFPVMALVGYSYRHISGPGLNGSNIMSHHSFGGAIDVNKPHNLFYLHKDKRKPKDPYYIPQSVINIFAKYGWAWGGNFKEGLDTMHFQYLGLDLTN